MEKFPEARDLLLEERILVPEEIHLVDPVEEAALLRVHSGAYLRSIRENTLGPREARNLGLPAGPGLLDRSRREVEGTRRACLAALDGGVGVNLAGGTHHAFPDHGEGFCVLNDVAVAVRDLWCACSSLRVFVLDTDAHQGNGTHFIFSGEERVFTYSIHVGRNYPSRKIPGSMDIELPRYVGGAEYLEALGKSFPGAVRDFRPGLVIWISGADPHANDRFGQMQLTVRDLLLRDRMVCETCRSLGLPLAILYGGGYNRHPGFTAKIHRNTVRLAKEVFEG